MRKLGFLLVVFALFVGCELKNEVTNNSDFVVVFTLRNHSSIEETLKPKESAYYASQLYLNSYTATPPRVSYTNNDNKLIEFYNTPPRQIKIINSLESNVIVTSQGCIDNEPVMVASGANVTETIYAENPVFSGMTTDGFPVKFTFSLDKQSVIVHW